MKKMLFTSALILLLVASLGWAGGQEESAAQGGDAGFVPAKVGEWIITYNPGSGSDVFTRNVLASFAEGKFTTANLPVVSKSEGSGMVGIQYVAQINDQDQANNTLITLGGGDLTEAIKIAKIKPGDIQPLALMVTEIPILSKGKECRYNDFNEAIADMLAGKQVIIGGPQNDYELMAKDIMNALGVTEKELTYIPYGSGKEGLTALMGKHVDFALSTPSHAAELIASGDVIPQWLFSKGHYQFGSLVDLPTFSEFTGGKYADMEYGIFRIVCASGKMSPAAVDYWVDCLDKATTTSAWEAYCAKYSLVTMFKPKDEAKPWM
jgi:putative tricarboxylic transport membrane protein